MSAIPVALYQVFLNDGSSFNIHQASCSLLTHMVRSRFIGREHGLRVFDCLFQDLADRTTVKQLKNTQAELREFTRVRPAHLILVINTHCDPRDGGIIYGTNRTTGLDSLCGHILGDNFPLEEFKKKVLFVVCCGGLVHHGINEIQAISANFDAVFAFGAPMLDPVLTIGQFVTSVVDFFVLGQEDLWRAIHLSLKQEIMKHTAIYVASGGQVQRICDAAWRRRPNGEDIRCCQQMAKYLGTDSLGMIKFRCSVSAHQGSRTFRVKPLPPVVGVRRFLGGRGGPRYMISCCIGA
ncbi:hypothetical protein C8T65DRAFT_588527 [Cerioporus squamosus]|nr:hypothetical protein C8T65DRAFT_588527 [Cerioporus squamosus]